MMNTPSVEQPRSMEPSPLQRLRSVESKLDALVSDIENIDFEIANLSYKDVINTLRTAIKEGETWALGSVLSIEETLNAYKKAKGVQRLDMGLKLREQISGLSDVGLRGKKAA